MLFSLWQIEGERRVYWPSCEFQRLEEDWVGEILISLLLLRLLCEGEFFRLDLDLGFRNKSFLGLPCVSSMVMFALKFSSGRY